MNIVLGITGSIAAYKACTLIRQFVKAGHEVQVVITPAGKEFVTPITLSALTSKPVVSEFFAQRDGSWHSHVALGQWADAMVIAPATASSIAKMAHGVADNMLITTYLSMKAPVFVAPAMDLDMYAHPTTQANLNQLRSYGNYIVEPGTGFLASHLEGKGRMEEPDEIFRQVMDVLQPEGCSNCSQEGRLVGRRVLITAGPTHESIDPARYIGNHSTGKMGFALAEAAAAEGAEVELIAGPVALSVKHPRIRRTDVVSAEQMHEAAMRLFPSCTDGILCAAVADYRPAQCADVKIKRETQAEMTLTLVQNPDIAAALGQVKTDGQRLVGFALETAASAEALHYGEDKLRRKNLDYIVVNSLCDAGAGFGVDTNKVTIVSANGQQQSLPLADKSEVAREIIRRCL
ncbi:MAG: bifunctional phosphopantothenoylcysteine decarboxylase/phosphopantothenate--cysteine ligase CoaBC [Bacteroidaceae bacterium]|nr:bifunctional phosphopantothenoylcysteine decarboxylase/phosphopantothenate--cysteine ligase CoaBC [Bacteroidaceae bacterium]